MPCVFTAMPAGLPTPTQSVGLLPSSSSAGGSSSPSSPSAFFFFEAFHECSGAPVDASKTCTRWLLWSQTKRAFSSFTAMFVGWSNWPSFLPLLPKDRRKLPSRSKIWIRWHESDTKTSFTQLTATSRGEVNCASSVPLRPNWRRNLKPSSMSKTWIRWFPESHTRTWPCSVSAMPLGNWNWPSPSPRLPTLLTWQISNDLELNSSTWSRWFSRSVTTSLITRSPCFQGLSATMSPGESKSAGPWPF
mmetsp:Transcript_114197/g.277243  ORF Transcript_114197/g.277243 Transcript_114197/m.277243 type:complete len:247 (+) Transcript_114197:142-882(+)